MSRLPATARLTRLLALVPWLLAHQGVTVAAAAEQFGLSEADLVKDLELLFVCGTPGHLPDDLIEADWESGRIFLSNADTIAHPLRLGLDEAVALIAGLRTLAAVPGLQDGDAVASALAKLTEAAGEAAGPATALQVDLSGGGPPEVLTAVREALQHGRRLQVRYLVPSRDETTDRQVDPIRLLNDSGRWYLEGWCHRAEDVRRFRLDRVVEVAVLDEPSETTGQPGAPARTELADVSTETLFAPSPDDPLVRLRVGRGARWVGEYYPVESVVELPDGGAEIGLRITQTPWLVQLALRTGAGLQIIDPPELAAEVARLAEAALAQY